MSTLLQVVEGFDVTLSGIVDLRVFDHVPADISSMTVPALCIMPPVIDYRDSLEDDTLYPFELLLLATGTDHRRGQHALFPYLDRTGPQSIYATVEANRSLGRPDVDAHVRSSRPLGLEEVTAFGAFGVMFTVSVVVSAV